jgi:hypothetical protein
VSDLDWLAPRYGGKATFVTPLPEAFGRSPLPALIGAETSKIHSHILRRGQLRKDFIALSPLLRRGSLVANKTCV